MKNHTLEEMMEYWENLKKNRKEEIATAIKKNRKEKIATAKYTVEEIVKYIEKYNELKYEYYDELDKETKIATFNMIFFDSDIKDIFGESEFCVAYRDTDDVRDIDYICDNSHPISDIIKIYEPTAE